jgi:hypothetical protein
VSIGLQAFLVACSTLRPLSATRTLDGYMAKDTIVVVPEACSFKPFLVTHTLPAGIYTPVLEDDDGVYFQSPSKLLLGDIWGPTLHDGGLFFKGGLSGNPYDYLIIENRRTHNKLPSNFKFRIERKQ